MSRTSPATPADPDGPGAGDSMALPDLSKKPKKKPKKGKAGGQTPLSGTGAGSTAPSGMAAAKGIMRSWLDQHQPRPVPGVTDSLSNRPGPRTPGEIASGHPLSATTPSGDRFDPGHTADVHLWQQVTRPHPHAVVQSVSGENTALASAISEHNGRVSVGLLDLRGAANASLTSQLRAEPSASPHLAAGPAHPAPSGHGQVFGVTPARSPGAAYLPGVRG